MAKNKHGYNENRFSILPIYGLCLLCNYLIPVRVKNYFKGVMKTNRFYLAIWERKSNVSLLHQGDDAIMDYI